MRRFPATAFWSRSSLFGKADGEGLAMGTRATTMVAAAVFVVLVSHAAGQVGSNPLEVVCEDNDGCAACEGDLGRCESELGGCNGNLETCASERTTCRSELEGCDAELTSCENLLAGCGAFLATGQDRTVVGGEDGNPARGRPLAYVDNGNGTITDLNTGLTWEKKNALDGVRDGTNLHDADNLYSWAGLCSDDREECGTDADCGAGATCGELTIFKWAEALNAESFAGHDDWRVPNIRELRSILDYGSAFPSVDPAFHTGASCTAPPCTDLTDPDCSCTSSATFYWSSTTEELKLENAWRVWFSDGRTNLEWKPFGGHVRAVRGGS